ncbi:GNAT family N-acetyltransferase [Microvirga sp. GCM10011540]|uniref:GNAT family N-acetyltransferase n=1 Tax=Microvirga sp. GCM10011540 TaxID=3317338 RepID=UPI00361B8D87
MIPEAYTIRLGRIDDLDRLAEVERSAAITYFAALGTVPDPSEVVPPRILTACCDAGLLWVAADRHDVPVGFLAAQTVDLCLFVKEMSVAREHQGAGLGRRLMQAAMDHAREASFPAAALTTDRLIPFNGPFYERLGFVAVPVGQASPGLRNLLESEIAAGFDPARRILMIRRLAALQDRAAPLYPEPLKES